MRNEIILDNNAKGSESMVFNTGAALLDAIVLAVVSREKMKELMDIRLRRM